MQNQEPHRAPAQHYSMSACMLRICLTLLIVCLPACNAAYRMPALLSTVGFSDCRRQAGGAQGAARRGAACPARVCHQLRALEQPAGR